MLPADRRAEMWRAQMAEKYSHDELVERLDEPGWRAVTGDTSQEGTLRQVTEAAHAGRAKGPGWLQHIATRIEVDALQLEKLWYYLGLPLA
jgi:hypothetical protein